MFKEPAPAVSRRSTFILGFFFLVTVSKERELIAFAWVGTQACRVDGRLGHDTSSKGGVARKYAEVPE